MALGALAHLLVDPFHFFCRPKLFRCHSLVELLALGLYSDRPILLRFFLFFKVVLPVLQSFFEVFLQFSFLQKSFVQVFI